MQIERVKNTRNQACFWLWAIPLAPFKFPSPFIDDKLQFSIFF